MLREAPGGALHDALTRIWDLPLGTHHVLGRSLDGVNPPVEAEALGPLTVANMGWVHTGGLAEADTGRATATFPDASSVVAGTFRGSITFGSGTAAEQTLTATAYDELCVARPAADGSLLWARLDGGDGATVVRDADAGPGGSTYVSGSFSGRFTFGSGESAETSFECTVSTDGFLARYGSDGELAWAQQVASVYYAEVHGVAALADGGAVVTGIFLDQATWDPGGPNETTVLRAANF